MTVYTHPHNLKGLEMWGRDLRFEGHRILIMVTASEPTGCIQVTGWEVWGPAIIICYGEPQCSDGRWMFFMRTYRVQLCIQVTLHAVALVCFVDICPKEQWALLIPPTNFPRHYPCVLPFGVWYTSVLRLVLASYIFSPQYDNINIIFYTPTINQMKALLIKELSNTLTRPP